MTILTKYILFQILIIIPFVIAYSRKSRFRNTESLSKKLISMNLIFIEPPVVLWSIWGLDLYSDLFFLPVAGVAIVLTGIALGYIYTYIAGLRDRKRRVFHISSALANHGFTMGGFICYLFLGERGLGGAFIFIAYFMPFLFLFVFPYAGLVTGKQGTGKKSIRGFIFNLRNMPFYAVIAALLLQYFGVKRPEMYFPVPVFFMVSIPVYYFTLGMSFRVGNLRGMMREHVSLALIKFLIIPFIVSVVLFLIDLDRTVEIIIFIQSFMPAAIYSVISSILFDLDSEFASGLFVINTLIFFIVVLPLIMLFRGIVC